MSTVPFSNPIGWAQFRLLGGWKNLFLTSGVYAAILIAAMFAIVRAARESASTTFGYFIGFFLGFQVLALVLYGTLRVAGAVRADVTSKVIESHRLMPMSPVNAVLGYLFGAPLQALALFAVNFVLGAIAVQGAGIAMQSWAFSNAVLLGFSVCLWTLVAFLSFRAPGAGVGVIAVLVLMFMSSGVLLALVPGLQVLISPMIGQSIFNMAGGRAADSMLFVAGLLQLMIASLYIYASARRYRRDDAVGFDAIAGLLLLLALTAANTVGLGFADSLTPWRRAVFGFHSEVPFIVSLTLLLLVGILPVASAVRTTTGESDNAGLPMLVVVLAALTIVCMTYLQPYARNILLARSLIVVIAFLAGMRYALGTRRRLRWRPRVMAIAWLVLSWGVPMLAETLRSAASTAPRDRMSQIGMCWAPGELFQIWSLDPLIHSLGLTGLLVQCVLVAPLAIVYHTGPRIGRRHKTLT